MHTDPKKFHCNKIYQVPAALVFSIVTFPFISHAQVNPPEKQTIEITSSFKPVLRESAKLGFTAVPPKPDSAKPRLIYNLPVSNVVPQLAPFSMKPIERAVDSAMPWSNANYIRAGYGNFKTPVIEAGLSFGDTRQRATIFANHISSRGALQNQDYSRTRMKAEAALPVGRNAEWNLKAGLSQHRYFQYGYDTAVFKNFTKDDLLRRYNLVSLSTGIRNLSPTEFGLRYQPQISLDILRDNRSTEEMNLLVDVPIQRGIGENFSIGLSAKADITRFTPDTKPAVNNQIFLIPIHLAYQGNKIHVRGGVSPSWDNAQFELLPNVHAEFPIKDQRFVFLAGWHSYFEKGSYQNFSAFNPYIDVPDSLLNTRKTEIFTGVRGVLAKTFTYSLRSGLTTFRNLPLYRNDPISGKGFQVIFEEQLNAQHIKAEMGYVQGEQFSLQASFNWYNFIRQRTEKKPWGMVPIELESHLRWKILSELWFRTDLFFWRGAAFPSKNSQTIIRPAGAADMNAGLEFRVARKFNIWVQANNITNTRYQRWNQYDCYGFNITGGAALQF